MTLSSPGFSLSCFAGGGTLVLRLTAVVALIAAFLCTTPARAVTIDWVRVGDPGNTADTEYGSFGSVADPYQIMKFEVTNSQYAAFLNAVAATSDPYHLGAPNMFSSPRGGLARTIEYSGTQAITSYTTKADMADKPVNFINWFRAARFANWLHNGQGSGSTETGAYTLVGGQTSGTAPARNPGAVYFIPTENQWYKAAYYKGGGTNAGYWDYATQSDTAPTAVLSGSTGIGTAGLGPDGYTGNFANYNNVADWNGQDGNVTSVGTNGGPGAYGTFDMSGNVYEWHDGNGQPAPWRGYRGGSYETNSFALSASGFGSFVTEYDPAWFGFRLAGLQTLTVTGSQVYDAPVTGIVTTDSGAPQFNSGFTGSLTVTGGTATLGGSVAGTVTIGAGAAATIASGASLTNAKVSLAPGAILAVARGTSVPIAAGNIGGITVSTTSGLAVQVLAGTVDADTTIFATTSPTGNFSATGGNRLVGEVLTFQGTGTATWVLQMQYNPATLPLNEATMADAGDLYLTWRNPDSNAWVNAVDGNTGGTKQLFQRAWLPGDTLGSYGVDVTSNTVWAVINHNSDFGIVAVPEPTTLALVASGLTCAGWGAFWRRKRA